MKKLLFITWIITSSYGTVSGHNGLNPQDAVKFLYKVLGEV